MRIAVDTVVVLVAGVAPLLALSVVARIRFVRRLATFRCRLGPPRAPWRRKARWRLRRTRAAWVSDVLVIQTGLLRLWTTPTAVVLPRDAIARRVRSHEVRGLGARPVTLRLKTQDGADLEIAVAAESAEPLVGPFLAAAVAEQPPAPRGRTG